MEEYREKDKLMIRENPTAKRLFSNFMERFGEEPYKILKCSPVEILTLAEKETEADNTLEYVFFDITGTVNDRDLVTLLAGMDYLFVPITPESGDLKSSIGFAHNVNELMLFQQGARVKGMFLLWNKVHPKDRNNLYQIIKCNVSTCSPTLISIREVYTLWSTS